MAWKINQNENDNEVMARVMPKIGVSSASKAILYMLHTYERDQEAHNKVSRYAAKIESELKQLKRLIRDKQQAEAEIMEIVNS